MSSSSLRPALTLQEDRQISQYSPFKLTLHWQQMLRFLFSYVPLLNSILFITVCAAGSCIILTYCMYVYIYIRIYMIYLMSTLVDIMLSLGF